MTDVSEPIVTALVDRGLVIEEEAGKKLQRQAMLLAAVVPAVGVIKIMIGISRDKPVAFLVILTIISVIVLFAAFGRRPLRSRFGDHVLKLLREQHSGLRRESGLAAVSPAHQGTLAMAVGLYGMTMLSNTAIADEYRRLQQNYTSSSGDSGSSGCGSDGGGGGGCGGGCGGCGGGGGD
jgi:uncharacterized protein (TIGR04222 family)